MFLPLGLFLVCVASVSAQDLRNDMLGTWRTRSAGYEPKASERMVTDLDQSLAPFYHGVASGDPLQDRVVIWTRVTPTSGGEVTVQWRVATDAALQQVVREGQTTTNAERDHTVKVDVSGLQPGTVYYYGFTALGKHSLTGRTRTAPVGPVDQARFAVVSCSNYPAGYFNAYARIADRNDLDAVLHLGDYIYEYDADTASYGGAIGKRLGRMHDPDKELVQLVDYRTRYAQYRLDPDLRKLHQQHPMMHVWDDHESANDAYTDGAQNHQANEGDWSVRKAISKQVCYEWLPTRDAPVLYRNVAFGDLAEIFMLDTRLDGRDQQIDEVGSLSTPESRAALNDPARRIISATQEQWLKDSMASSTATWKIIGNQVMFSPIDVTPIDTAFLYAAVGPVVAAFLRPQMPLLQGVMDQAFYGDVWNNYPANRTRLTQFFKQQSIRNIVFATGDFHSSFAFNVVDFDRPSDAPCAVEFMTPSISAANFDENLASTPTTRPLVPQLVATVDRTLRNENPHLSYENLVDHGYVLLDVTPQQVQGDFFHVDTLYVRPSPESWAKGFVVTNGTAQLNEAPAAAPGKPVQDVPAPPFPPNPTSVAEERPSPLTIMSVGPRPSADVVYVAYHLATDADVRISVIDLQGAVVQRVHDAREHAGLHSVMVNVSDLSAGRYELVINTGAAPRRTAMIIQR